MATELGVVDWAQMVALYLKARDKLDALKKQYEADCEPIKRAMEKMEILFLGNLQAQNAESMRTMNGTFFKQGKVSVTVSDKTEFTSWLKADFDGRAAYADIRAAKLNIVQ